MSMKRFLSLFLALSIAAAAYPITAYAAEPEASPASPAAPSAAEPGLWCFTYSSKKNGRTMVVFQPEERVLGALKAGLTKLVQLDMNRKLAK